jgi:peptide deformylase
MLSIETGADNKTLRNKSKPVKAVTKKVLKFIREMEDAMEAEKGVGLAAPQVGLNERIVLVTIGQKVIPMINPEIIAHSDKTEWAEEGCLSLPGQWAKVERYQSIAVRYLDEKGRPLTLNLSGFDARVVQHEVDHLEGILFTDYLEMETGLTSSLETPLYEKL